MPNNLILAQRQAEIAVLRQPEYLILGSFGPLGPGKPGNSRVAPFHSRNLLRLNGLEFRVGFRLRV